jgi:MFS family permease
VVPGLRPGTIRSTRERNDCACDGLHRLGLVERSEDAHDRRVRHLALTATGTEFVGRLRRTRSGLIERVCALLDTTIVNVAIDTLARDLHASLGTIQWVATGYMLALATVIPLTDWATERFGSRRLFLLSAGLFAIGSALCGFAWSASSLIGFRVLQGLGGGMLTPVGMTILTRAAGPQRVGRVMSVIGVPMLLAAVVGPVLGGWLVQDASWRYGLAETASNGGLGSGRVLASLLLGLLLIGAFVVHALRAERPLIDLRLFARRGFAAGAATTFLLGGALFGAMILLPLYYQVVPGSRRAGARARLRIDVLVGRRDGCRELRAGAAPAARGRPQGTGRGGAAGGRVAPPAAWHGAPRVTPIAIVRAVTQPTRGVAATLALAVVLAAAGCGKSSSGSPSSGSAGPATTASAGATTAPVESAPSTTGSATSPVPTVPAAPPGPCGRTTKRPKAYEHVIWIVFENRDPSQVAEGAPGLSSLARTCGSASSYKSVAHPTLPNMLALTSGSTYGVKGDGNPSLRAQPDAQSIFELATSWKVYAESMPGPCIANDRPPLYAVRDNPAVYYGRLSGTVCEGNVPLGTRRDGALASDLKANTLPQFSLILPNRCNDMHDCPTIVGDRWARRWLQLITSSRVYRHGRTAIFVTWDENRQLDQPNNVALFAVAPAITPGAVDALPVNHYSLLRTTQELLGLQPLLGNAAHARSMRARLGL